MNKAKKLQKIGSNQKVLTLLDTTKVLLSYETPVAMIYPGGDLAVRTKEFHSKTTSKHINQWLADIKTVYELPQAVLDKVI